MSLTGRKLVVASAVLAIAVAIFGDLSPSTAADSIDARYKRPAQTEAQRRRLLEGMASIEAAPGEAAKVLALLKHQDRVRSEVTREIWTARLSLGIFAASIIAGLIGLIGMRR